MTTLHPVAPASGLCVKGVAPVPAGQTVPAQAEQVPIASSVKFKKAVFIAWRSFSVDQFGPKPIAYVAIWFY
jgi:hypothetical protein